MGYDIYCTSWENLQKKSELDCVGVSSLTDLQILYYSKSEYLDKFNELRMKALCALAEAPGISSVKRAKKHLDNAKQEYADLMLADGLGGVRYSSCGVVYHLVNCLVSLNNTCIKRGIKRYFEELLTYDYLPENFEHLYMSVIESKTIDEIKVSSLSLLKAVARLYEKMNRDFSRPLSPTFDNLKGTYEELWSNCRNKVINSTAENDKSYAYFAAMGAQNYLDEMAEVHCGTKKFDLMQHFIADDLDLFKSAFLEAMDEYLQEYVKVGRKVEHFNSFDELYETYMSK
jgi:hypothetical protein